MFRLHPHQPPHSHFSSSPSLSSPTSSLSLLHLFISSHSFSHPSPQLLQSLLSFPVTLPTSPTPLLPSPYIPDTSPTLLPSPHLTNITTPFSLLFSPHTQAILYNLFTFPLRFLLPTTASHHLSTPPFISHFLHFICHPPASLVLSSPPPTIHVSIQPLFRYFSQ
ncbi:hypothetical protein Pcinc_023617 [Petrolisthes cinctipes]|uniref:Uncharacterized protein n=1 Tax=Petrolisthes cinctipes TaxID=88211 RepID=A0AAE1FCL6_PETCI|nr:hypothetical protein Pcinc_023617 [Petrolisthes cinctipes]